MFLKINQYILWQMKLKNKAIYYGRNESYCYSIWCWRAYTNTKREILLTVIPSKEYFEITESIKLLDPNIFYVVSDAYEVKGAK